MQLISDNNCNWEQSVLNNILHMGPVQTIPFDVHGEYDISRRNVTLVLAKRCNIKQE